MQKILPYILLFLLVAVGAYTQMPSEFNKFFIGAGSRIYDAGGIRFYTDNQATTYGTNVIDWVNKSGGLINTNKLMSGALIMQSDTGVVNSIRGMVTNIYYVTSTTYSSPDGTNIIDLLGVAYQSITLTNNITLISSNTLAGRSVTLRCIGSGTSSKNVVLPSWMRLAGSLTNAVASNQIGIVSVTYFDASDTNAIASWVTGSK